MPGPAIYVVAAIGTVAAVIAFKEFVYDPHLRPKFDAWRDSRQRERNNRGRRAVAVPLLTHTRSSSSTSDGDEDKIPRRRRKSSPSSSYSTSPIELEKLVAREMDEWGSGVDVRGDQSGLRFRHGRGPSSTRTLSTPDYLDEQPKSSILTPSLEPSRNEQREVLFHYPASPVLSTSSAPALPSSPNRTDSPAAAVDFDSNSAVVANPFADNASYPATPLPLEILAHTLTTPASNAPLDAHTSRISTPDIDFLTSSMLTSDYLTPLGGPQSLRPSPSPSPNRALSPSDATFDILSPPSPRSMSPFSDMGSGHAGMRSPPTEGTGTDAFLSPPSNMSDLPSEFDDDMFSLPSEPHATSEAVEEEGEQFEVGSDESDDWTGIDDDFTAAH